MAGFYLFTMPGTDVRPLSSNEVRLAFVLRLPFRFKVSGFWRYARVDEGIELYLHNRVPVPEGTDQSQLTLELIRKPSGSLESLCTDALVVIQRPKVTLDE